MISYQDMLSNEYLRRQSKNPTYSMRSFARDLGFGSPQIFYRMGSANHPEDREDRSEKFKTGTVS